MDTLTQAALGAAVGQAGFAATLGRRALAWGAVGGLVPDLDTLAIPLAGPLAEFEHHRGATHALWFGPLVGPLLGYAVWRWQARRARRGGPPAGPLAAWVSLFVFALLTHPLLDLFTVYGTQLLYPFSDRRFALPAVPIIDPLYTLPLLAAVALFVLRPGRPRLAARAAAAALALGTAYLFAGLAQNGLAEAEVRRRLAAEGARAERIRVYPTMFQIFLRRAVVRTREEVRVGFVSTLRPRPIRWRRHPVDRDPLVERARATPEARLLDWFADGETLARVVETPEGRAVEITDLRYGFPGWSDWGLWGVRARFDRDGRPLGRPARLDVPRRADPAQVVALFRAALGLPNEGF